MERFRPNVVVTAVSLEQFVEEYSIGCNVRHLDPATATVGGQTLETVTQLSTERHPGKPA